MSKENLVMRIIMQANDKASAAFKNIHLASNGLAGSLLKTKKEMRDLEKTQTVFNKYGDNVKRIKEIDRSLLQNTQSIKQLSIAMKGSEAPTKSQKEALAKLKKESRDLKDEQSKLRIKTQELSATMTKAGYSAVKMTSTKQALKQKSDALRQSYDKEKASLERLNGAEKKYQNAMNLRNSMRSTGASAFIAGGAATAAGVSLMKPGFDFEKDFARVQALTRLDKTKDAQTIAQLRNNALDLGANTSFTSGQVAQGQGYLAMAGFKPEAIISAMPGILNMAKAAGMDEDLGRVSDIGSDILSGFQLKASQMDHASDVLTATFTSTNTSLELMGESMKYIGPAASAAGVSFEEAAAMVGKLGDVGIKGSQAGTSLRAMLLRMGDKGQIHMKKIGVSAKDDKGNLRPIFDILKDIHAKTKNMGSADQLKTYQKIFGVEASTAGIELMNQAASGKLEAFTKELQNSAGTAQKTADIMADTLKGDVDNLLSAKEAISISLFDQNNGVMRTFVQDLTAVLRNVNAWVKANPELAATIFKVVAVTTVLMTVLGGMAMALSMVIGPLALLRLSWAKLFIGLGSNMGVISTVFNLLKTGIMAVGRTLLMNPIGLIITGIVALVAAGYYLWKHWDKVKEFFVSMWQKIDSVFENNPILNFIFPMVGAARLLINNWQAVKDFFVSTWQSINNVFASYPILNYIFPVVGIARLLIDNWQAVVSFFASAWQSIKSFFGSGIGNISATIINWSPLGLFHRAFAAVLSFFGIEIPAKMTNFGAMIVQGLINGLKSKFAALSGFWSTVTGMFNNKMRQANDIRSPSRVMAGLGRYIMQGLAVGVQHGKAGLENTYDKAISLFQNPITTGGFLDRAVKTFMPEGNPMHPQLAGAIAAPSAEFGAVSNKQQSTSVGGDNITIQIFAGNNDVGSIRKEIEQVLRERDMKKQRARRSSFWDKD